MDRDNKKLALYIITIVVGTSSCAGTTTVGGVEGEQAGVAGNDAEGTEESTPSSETDEATDSGQPTATPAATADHEESAATDTAPENDNAEGHTSGPADMRPSLQCTAQKDLAPIRGTGAAGVAKCEHSDAFPDFLVVAELQQDCTDSGLGPQVLRDGIPVSCEQELSCEGSETCFEGACYAAPECDADAECMESQSCLCAFVEPLDVGYAVVNDQNRCVDVQCRHATDCGEYDCALSLGSCAQVEGVYCHGAEDECYSNADCGADGFCSYAGDERRWKCIEAIHCD